MNSNSNPTQTNAPIQTTNQSQQQTISFNEMYALVVQLSEGSKRKCIKDKLAQSPYNKHIKIENDDNPPLSLASVLVMNGYIDVAIELIDFGADIDSITYALGRMGQINELHNLIQMGGNVREAIRGVAECHPDLLANGEEGKKQVISSFLNQYDNLITAHKNAIEAGVIQLPSRKDDIPYVEADYEAVYHAAMGYILGGHDIPDWLLSYVIPKENIKYYKDKVVRFCDHVAYTMAQKNLSQDAINQFTQNLAKKIHSKMKYGPPIGLIQEGYLDGGHYERIQDDGQLLQSYAIKNNQPMINQILNRLCPSGDFYHDKFLRQKLLKGYAVGGHINQVNAILDVLRKQVSSKDYSVRVDALDCFDAVFREYFHSGRFSEAYKLSTRYGIMKLKERFTVALKAYLNKVHSDSRDEKKKVFVDPSIIFQLLTQCPDNGLFQEIIQLSYRQKSLISSLAEDYPAVVEKAKQSLAWKSIYSLQAHYAAILSDLDINLFVWKYLLFLPSLLRPFLATFQNTSKENANVPATILIEILRQELNERTYGQAEKIFNALRYIHHQNNLDETGTLKKYPTFYYKNSTYDKTKVLKLNREILGLPEINYAQETQEFRKQQTEKRKETKKRSGEKLNNETQEMLKKQKVEDNPDLFTMNFSNTTSLINFSNQDVPFIKKESDQQLFDSMPSLIDNIKLENTIDSNQHEPSSTTISYDVSNNNDNIDTKFLFSDYKINDVDNLFEPFLLDDYPNDSLFATHEEFDSSLILENMIIPNESNNNSILFSDSEDSAPKIFNLPNNNTFFSGNNLYSSKKYNKQKSDNNSYKQFSSSYSELTLPQSSQITDVRTTTKKIHPKNNSSLLFEGSSSAPPISIPEGISSTMQQQYIQMNQEWIKKNTNNNKTSSENEWESDWVDETDSGSEFYFK